VRKLLPVLAVAAAGCIPPPYERRVVVRDPGPPVAREELERLAGAGISDPVIAEVVERRGAQRLAADDLVALKRAGLGDALLEKIVAAEQPDPPRRVVEVPLYLPAYSSWTSSWGW
jgi:hypothetical protein